MDAASKSFFGPRMSPDMERIVERVYTVDIEKTYERVERSLQLSDERSDYASVSAALDRAETMAREAHKLFLASKLEVDRFEADYLVSIGAMRTRALAKLEEEKAEGTRTARIVKDDIEQLAATMFPDEYRFLQERRAKAKGAAAHMEKLTDIAMARIRTLQVMLSNLRK